MTELIALLVVLGLCGAIWLYVTRQVESDRLRRLDEAWKRYADDELRKKLVMESHWTYPKKEAHGTTDDLAADGAPGSLGAMGVGTRDSMTDTTEPLQRQP